MAGPFPPAMDACGRQENRPGILFTPLRNKAGLLRACTGRAVRLRGGVRYIAGSLGLLAGLEPMSGACDLDALPMTRWAGQVRAPGVAGSRKKKKSSPTFAPAQKSEFGC